MNQQVRKFIGGIRQENTIQLVFNDMLNSNGDAFYWVAKEKNKLNLLD